MVLSYNISVKGRYEKWYCEHFKSEKWGWV